MPKTTLDMQMEGEGWVKYADVTSVGRIIVNDMDLIATLNANKIRYAIRSDIEVPLVFVNSFYVRKEDYKRLCGILAR